MMVHCQPGHNQFSSWVPLWVVYSLVGLLTVSDVFQHFPDAIWLVSLQVLPLPTWETSGNLLFVVSLLVSPLTTALQ